MSETIFQICEIVEALVPSACLFNSAVDTTAATTALA